VKYESAEHSTHGHHDKPSRPGTPRRGSSNDQSIKSDLENGTKSPNDTTDMQSLSPEAPKAIRRLSKKSKYEPSGPEDTVIVVPGEDSGPEDAPGSSKRPPMYETRQNTLVGGIWTEIENKRKSTGSIAAQSVLSRTGSVKVIVKPDGQMNRVLSRRSSMVGATGYASDREDDRRSTKSGRRLSKRRPDSEARNMDSSSRMSRSEDGFWSAAEDLSRASRRASVIGSPRSADREENDTSTIKRKSHGADDDDTNVNDDPLSQYYWDPQRGWLERT
jgi:hypothetical protein